jgi:hypothetical protein
MEYIIVADGKQENVQQGIPSPTGRVTESLEGHDLLKGRIKPIDNG